MKNFLVFAFVALISVSASAYTPPVGSTGSPQINNAGNVYGAPVPDTSQTSTSAATNAGTVPPKALAAISSGMFVDPRAYGAQCTGWYGISSVVVGSGGTGFAVGNQILLQDDNVSNMGGYVSVPAKAHVTAVSGGVVTGIALDTPGSGYRLHLQFTMPLTGNGNALSVNVNGIRSGPSAPTVTLASGGGPGAAPSFGYNHIAGGSYNVGDLFAIPNPSLNSNYLVGRVDSVTANKAIATFHFYNFGGDYAIVSSVPAITITGSGSGATFNVTSATSAGGTFDDTYGILRAQMVAREAGGVTLLPDNCWVQTLPQFDGAILMGLNDAPSYGYNTFFQTGNTNPSGPKRAPILNIIKTPSTYAIDLNGSNSGVLRGFQILPYTGQTFGGSTAWDTTIAIGSSVTCPNCAGGNGAGGQGPWYIDRMSAHYFKYALGTQGSADPLVFLSSHSNDWSGNNSGGIYGALSDFVTDDDTIASVNNYCIELTGGGGTRINNLRCEFAGGGLKFNGFGSLRVVIANSQMTRITYCGILALNTQQINMTGGTIDGAGLAGSLKVTGAANNGSGLIRLTVTGQCSTSGGVATCNLATGDIANVQAVGGTTEANGNQWTITKVDNTHIDLQGSTFTNAYTSGGTVAVNQKGAQICLQGTTGFSASNVLLGGYSSGAELPSAVILDSVSSTNISIVGNGGKKGTGSSNLDTYQQDFANWHNSGNTPSVNTHIDTIGQAYYDNTNVPTTTGLTLTTTTGGIRAMGGLTTTTTTGGTLTLSALPATPGGWNCQGGNTTTGTSWAMTASTSTSCALGATTTNGDAVWWSGQAR